MSRRLLAVMLGLAAAGLTGGMVASAEAPKIGKPRPAPDTPPDVPPLPPAIYDGSLMIGGEDVNARKERSRLSVEVKVNGNGPYRFVVDSGADTSVIGLKIARGLQLPLATPAVLNSMTARNVVDRVHVDQLAVGSSAFRNLQLPALREVDLGGEGLIGIDALVAQRLMMDFEKKSIKVEDARIPVRAMPGEIVVTAYRRRGQLILTQVKAAGLPIEGVIDTGSEITIGNLALRDKLIRGHRDKFWTVQATGVTGVTMDLQMAVIGELQLGPVILKNVPMAFADVPPFALFGLDDHPALLLGTDMLENFRRISLDFRARKVRFQLKKCGSTGIVVRTSLTRNFSRLSSSGGVDVCGR